MKKVLVGIIIIVTVFGCTNTASTEGNGVNEMEKIAENGDSVRVDYVGFFDDQKVFDTSIQSEAETAGLPLRSTYEPLEVTLGEHQVIPGFENALMGMKEGEEKTVHILAKDAYGEIDPAKIVAVPNEQFGDAFAELSEGISIQTSYGPARVLEINTNTVTLDFNPEMAGKALNFRLIMKSIQKKE